MSDVSESVEIVTREEIEEKQAATVDEALRGVSGVTVNRAASVDPWQWVRIRGANADQVLILVDGVEINNPYSGITPPQYIQTEGIERIEVLKGSHSALYGTAAIGGVINIITREGKEKPETDISVKGGNYETSTGSFFHAAKRDDLSYSIGYSGFATESNEDIGPFSGNTVSGKARYKVGKYSYLQLNSFYWDYAKKDGLACCGFDDTGAWLQLMQPDRSVYKEHDWLNSVQFSQYPSASWDYNLRYSRYDFRSDKDLIGDSDLLYPLKIDSENTGSRDIIEARTNVYPYEGDILSVGVQYREERLSTSEFSNMDSFGTAAAHEQPSIDSLRHSRAAYIQNILTLQDRLTVSAGARVEDGLGYGDDVLPRVSASYSFPSTSTKIKGAYGKGIKAPSLFQLFDSLEGNKDLKPERSESWEATIEQTIDRYKLEVTYFHMDFKNLITWTDDLSDISFRNIGDAWAKGVETQATARDVLKGLDLNVVYTYLETRDEDKDEPLRFRPMNDLYIDVTYRGIKRLTLDASVEFAGPSFNPYSFMKDVDGNQVSDKNPSYQVVNLAASYLIPHPKVDRLELQFKVNNLFNESYTEIPDIKAEGIKFLAGVRVGF